MAVTGYYKQVVEGSLNKQYHISLFVAYFSFWDLCQTHRHKGSQDTVIYLPLIYFLTVHARYERNCFLKRKIKLAMNSLSFEKPCQTKTSSYNLAGKPSLVQTSFLIEYMCILEP